MNILIVFLIFGTVIAAPSLDPQFCRSNSCQECLRSRSACLWMITSHDEAKCSPVVSTTNDDEEILAFISYRAAHLCPNAESSTSIPDRKLEGDWYASLILLVLWVIAMVFAIILYRKQCTTSGEIKMLETILTQLTAQKGPTRLTAS